MWYRVLILVRRVHMVFLQCKSSCQLYQCSGLNSAVLHYKNTWATSTTFFGCLSCISVTKECCQIGFLEISLKSFFSSYISQYLLFRRPIWLHCLHFFHNHATHQELSKGRCVRAKKQQTSPEMLIYRLLEGDTNLEGSFSTTLCSNCKHSLNFMCQPGIGRNASCAVGDFA